MARGVYTVECSPQSKPWEGTRPPNDPSVDLCLIRFDDVGNPVLESELPNAVNCIETARVKNPNGALVVTFIHGWQHDATWDALAGTGDSHLAEFRKLLIRLAYRECERYGAQGPAGRRVIGIYISWPGTHKPFLIPECLRFFAFGNRYRAARKLGLDDSIRSTIEKLVVATKSPLPATESETESPMVLMGHSMGALILQNAFRSLLCDKRESLVHDCPDGNSQGTTTRMGDKRIRFPDLVLLINSATESGIAKSTIHALREATIRRHLDIAHVSYRLPVVISVASTTDIVTKLYFRIGRPFKKTDGNDKSLQTHKVTRVPGGFISQPLVPFPRDGEEPEGPPRDFGQSWHSLREPNLDGDTLTSVAVDLPQLKDPRDPCHVRFLIERAGAKSDDEPFWVISVPPEIINGHSDLFNGRSNLLLMALMQVSGAVMSLAENWRQTFEQDQGECQLREGGE